LAEPRTPGPAGAAHGAPGDAAHAHHPHQQHHFYSMAQQYEASVLAMWVFLVTEIMFFGGMFMAYLVYRTSYPQAWVESSHELNVYLGAANTLVLICSSLTMVLAVRSAQVGSRIGQVVNLILTILLGTTFLVIKYFEYAAKFEHHLVPGPTFRTDLPFGSQLFFSLYFCLTGVHALHMVVGIGLMLVMLVLAWRGRFTPDYYNQIEISGLYWHFVDIVWIFLFPLLYLVGFHYTGA
jgi:cytochrome c oxidase subunit 3